jgi:glycosyltransferase involved in cell wall biosynthesis
MVAGRALHQGSWDMVARFLAVSRHQADLVGRGGLPADRIHVKPNSVPDLGPAPDVGDDVLYLGRLADEKGVRELVGGWRSVQKELTGRLVIAGDGDLRDRLAASLQVDDRVDLLGNVAQDQVRGLFAGVGLVVVPSLWAETFGRTAVEAMSAGRRVLVSDRGGLPELAVPGAVDVRPPTPEALADGIRAAFAGDLAANGARARAAYLRHYTPEIVTEELVGHYRSVTAFG